MMECTEASASSARWAPAGGCPGVGIAPSGRSGKEEQQGVSTPLIRDFAAGAGHSCVCRNHHPLYCTLAGQQEHPQLQLHCPFPNLSTFSGCGCACPQPLPHTSSRQEMSRIHTHLSLLEAPVEQGGRWRKAEVCLEQDGLHKWTGL